MKNVLWLFLFCALAHVTSGGCSSYANTAAPVEGEKALQTLRSALDAWKAGESIESLATKSPAIVAQDFDWMQGKRLASYEVLGEGVKEDANLKVDVKLTIEGSETGKKVTYVVGTSPKLTVFRKAFD